MGVRWLRTDLNWASVQERGGQLRLARYGPDRRPWPPASALRCSRSWARRLNGPGRTPKVRRPPATPPPMGVFWQIAVKRYAPRGIHSWEIWNEPNLSGPFPPRPDPAAYAALLRAGSAQFARPTRRRPLSWAGWPGDPDPPDATRPHRRRRIPGGRLCRRRGVAFDAVGFHPYTGSELPDLDARRNSWGLMAGPIRAVMAANGDADKKIWITEYGAATNPGRRGTAEERQAEMLAGWRRAGARGRVDGAAVLVQLSRSWHRSRQSRRLVRPDRVGRPPQARPERCWKAFCPALPDAPDALPALRFGRQPEAASLRGGSAPPDLERRAPPGPARTPSVA